MGKGLEHGECTTEELAPEEAVLGWSVAVTASGTSLVHSHTRYLVRGPDCLEAPRAHQIIWWGGHQISGSSWKLQVALQGPDIWSEVTRYLAGAPGRYLVGR